ncbi:MAG TPA: SLC13 family permease, partial [Spirochaetota bacterium]|nr:SLC13 family permease [Spirochaetota bacterium]
MNLLVMTGLILFLMIYILMTFDVFNKTIIVLIGASIFIALGFINQEKAFLSIDWNVIFLLISMMIIVGITKNTGLFQFIAIKAAKFAKGEPVLILILLSLITALFSAFLDNVTTVLILTPVCILIAVELGISPIPFVISIAIASNIGGTATLIGDPPNIMIGSAAGLNFNDFLINLTPVILIILVVFCFVFYFMFKKKLVVTIERKA